METKMEITKSNEYGLKFFNYSHTFVLSIILFTDIIIVSMMLTSWINLTPIVIIFKEAPVPLYVFLFYLYLITPLIQTIFVTFEVLRFIQYLKNDKENKENAFNVARGNLGTKIVRIYYLIVIGIMIIFMEFFQAIVKLFDAQDQEEYLFFYSIFTPILIINIISIAVGPLFSRFSIDYRKKVNKVKFIVFANVWILVVGLLFNIDTFLLILEFLFSPE